MVMGFKTEINGKPTFFPEKILAGTKIHSIREGIRWKPGMLIHPATGVRTPKYRQITPEPLKVVSVQDFSIKYCEEYPGLFSYNVFIDECERYDSELSKLSKNDGFESFDLFIQAFLSMHPGGLKGQIVHWTDYRY